MQFGDQAPIGTDSMRRFSLIWKGFLRPLYTEMYTFYFQSKGEMNFTINHISVIQSLKHSNGSIQLPLVSGVLTPVLLQFAKVDDTPKCSFQVEWSSVSEPRQVHYT
jgi:hypothetical protein